eukprot:TRINITY_DN10581_c0_g2_i1.p1 TRINITY_DN10581_c0_g2~~TRINITY_DN10581_c0_g2_i1.p1  ORF type:complete len:339 (+),score=52.52 TRINITY_DN10581_c0_g2_i1:65-1081(+)
MLPDSMRIANLLPPVFIVVIIATIWGVHVLLHLVPLLQFHTDAACYEQPLQKMFLLPVECRSFWQVLISQSLTALLVFSYLRAMSISPGTVPEGPEWKPGSMASTLSRPETREVKTSGQRRHCKWCLTYKPDRCHHCRICGTCVLRMDHHCPWIMNCVGLRNHKYFFLLVIYSLTSCLFMGGTIIETVCRSINEEAEPRERFFLVFCLVLCSILGLLMGVFLCFHSWLMFNAMTTIEFCEKALPRPGPQNKACTLDYSQGFYGDITSVLGSNPLLWFLPTSPPKHDGVTFKAAVKVISCNESDGPSEGEGPDPEWTGKSLKLDAKEAKDEASKPILPA